MLDATGRLLERAREERRPAVLEAMTYRFRGHSVADAGWSYRSKEEVEEHEHDDPIDRAADRLVDLGVIDRSEFDDLRERADERVQEAVEFADNSDFPDEGSLGEHVYGDPDSAEQVARMTSGAPFGEADLLASGGPRE